MSLGGLLLKCFAANPIVILIFLLGVDMAPGHIKIKGASLGAVAVLFLAIAVSTWGGASDVELKTPREVTVLDLALFTFCIGTSAGASFFATLKTAWKAILLLIGRYIVTCLLGVGIGMMLGTSVV